MGGRKNRLEGREQPRLALYIKDSEVDGLAAALAAAKKVNKTEAVREALKNELERERGKPSLGDLAARFSRELRARGRPKRGRHRSHRPRTPATLSFGDASETQPGDVFEIEAEPFGQPLRNPLARAADGVPTVTGSSIVGNDSSCSSAEPTSRARCAAGS